MHQIAHQGEFFSVQGPLNLPRTPQGHPVLVQAGGSGDGRALAARYAEAVVSASQSFEEALSCARDLKSRAEALGRGPEALRVLPGLTTIIGDTEAAARRRRNELVDLIPWDCSLARLAGILGIAPDHLKLDERLPENLSLPCGSNGNHTFFNATLATARRLDLTAREPICELAGGGGHRVIVGTPEQIADDIERWSRAGAADGFNLMPDVLPDGLQAFVDGVVPLLQRRGIFRTEYQGSTLRALRPGHSAGTHGGACGGLRHCSGPSAGGPQRLRRTASARCRMSRDTPVPIMPTVHATPFIEPYAPHADTSVLPSSTDMRMNSLFRAALASLVFSASWVAAAPVNKCVVDGKVMYQQDPCPTGQVRKPPTVQELNAAEQKRRATAAMSPPRDASPLPAKPSGFSCDGRQYCSQMKSCAEAKYFLAYCPGAKMDGDKNGIPCEQQWCSP